MSTWLGAPGRKTKITFRAVLRVGDAPRTRPPTPRRETSGTTRRRGPSRRAGGSRDGRGRGRSPGSRRRTDGSGGALSWRPSVVVEEVELVEERELEVLGDLGLRLAVRRRREERDALRELRRRRRAGERREVERRDDLRRAARSRRRACSPPSPARDRPDAVRDRRVVQHEKRLRDRELVRARVAVAVAPQERVQEVADDGPGRPAPARRAAASPRRRSRHAAADGDARARRPSPA